MLSCGWTACDSLVHNSINQNLLEVSFVVSRRGRGVSVV